MDTRSRSGILLVDKDAGMTSHDVVSRTRRLVGTRRVGHAGTLDPMATGLLILGLNGATRLLTYLVGLDKEYSATIRLGGSTPTDDADSEVDVVADAGRLAAVTDADIAGSIAALTGDIEQVPSTISAIKVDGRRAYARARAGETVELRARPVTVSAFEVLGTRRGEFIDLDVRVECSTGTYVRALARDLGADLGVGGHLTALRRTRVGPFGVSEAHRLDELDLGADRRAPSDIARALFPVLELTAEESVDLGHGKKVEVGERSFGMAGDASGPVAAIAPDGRLVGLVTVGNGHAAPLINLPAEGDAA
ncbi:tRNA pseudouridine(55) synthase TruB [Terrimesophilobacter mesophilus]|uniref:tRNA pseudouridine synthase B n=1 Tax=Terrimesophilobacter mesophilus TaxID=433647 RepID=A0A4R8VEQ6_9MICO|nr:tRNA pseudouridine(55) synthase TruB [Terrimesophilobacter mesophilus]TFB80662.1 tRNA pseudouridine(55) synthase TruB [Terrimesophilobacter mesophilus]